VRGREYASHPHEYGTLVWQDSTRYHSDFFRPSGPPQDTGTIAISGFCRCAFQRIRTKIPPNLTAS
jgi:hypothetical protein